jgi:hypothetical protein
MFKGTLVYREYENNSISVHILQNNQLELKIIGLQDNTGIDENGVATVRVLYPTNIHLYDVIKTVLDTIIDDHRYKLQSYMHTVDRTWSEGILLSNTNTDMEFNRENIQYLEEYEPIISNPESIIIHGDVFDNGTFKYDYPIVSSHVEKEYYRMTRGKRVWDIKYNTKSKMYYKNNWEEAVRKQYHERSQP